MKKILLIALLFAALLWLSFGAMLLGIYEPTWLPAAFLQLKKPTTLSDFGQAFSALDGLTSSLALMLGLIAIVIQAKQNSESNVISAFTARQQFLLSEYQRLDNQIKEYIEKNSSCPDYDGNLIRNMTNKRKEYLEESKKIDLKILELLSKI